VRFFSSISAFLSTYAVSVSREEAMLAGLLQDFGVLVLSTFSLPYKGQDKALSFDHDALIKLEQSFFDSDHSFIGGSF
ncbi:hypothetical protein, partial [Actinoplanes utahensis]|uniref:hypothetical protein n=1 Tax=Actinoplanes utahensis TaxID=1869 RepID=UPI00360A98A9